MDYFDYGTEFQEFDVEEFLEQSQQRERQRLEEELERIEQQLDQREQLHEEMIDDLESKLDWYLDQLETLYKPGRRNRERKDEVKSRIKEFYREIREKKRKQWLDRQDLEQERREILRELAEMEDDDLLREFL